MSRIGYGSFISALEGVRLRGSGLIIANIAIEPTISALEGVRLRGSEMDGIYRYRYAEISAFEASVMYICTSLQAFV